MASGGHGVDRVARLAGQSVFSPLLGPLAWFRKAEQLRPLTTESRLAEVLHSMGQKGLAQALHRPSRSQKRRALRRETEAGCASLNLWVRFAKVLSQIDIQDISILDCMPLAELCSHNGMGSPSTTSKSANADDEEVAGGSTMQIELSRGPKKAAPRKEGAAKKRCTPEACTLPPSSSKQTARSWYHRRFQEA